MSGEAAGRVLVVDDTEMNRDMLSRRLKRSGFSVETEDGGAAALKRLESESFDLVVLDVMMPDVDGITVLKSIRRRFSSSELPVLMATAKDESEDVIIALEAGANDYVTKPLDFPVVMARVRTQLALKRSHEQLRHANARMKEDLDAAARVQQALIPQKAPANDRLAAAWLYRPCTELGGDIFDVVAIDDRYVAFYLVDVSGHGVPAALMSVSISRLLSHSAADSLLRNGQGAAQPAEIAGTLNRRFQMNGDGDGTKDGPKQYFTLVYALFDAETGQLTFTAAGHPGPIHVCRNGKCDHLQMASFAIGWFPQAEYEQRTVTLAPGDRVYLFSDGVLDERNAGGEMFEAERLADMLQSLMSLPLQRSLDELLLELQNWNAGQPFSDDISVVALEFK